MNLNVPSISEIAQRLEVSDEEVLSDGDGAELQCPECGSLYRSR